MIHSENLLNVSRNTTSEYQNTQSILNIKQEQLNRQFQQMSKEILEFEQRIMKIKENKTSISKEMAQIQQELDELNRPKQRTDLVVFSARIYESLIERLDGQTQIQQSYMQNIQELKSQLNDIRQSNMLVVQSNTQSIGQQSGGGGSTTNRDKLTELQDENEYLQNTINNLINQLSQRIQ